MEPKFMELDSDIGKPTEFINLLDIVRAEFTYESDGQDKAEVFFRGCVESKSVSGRTAAELRDWMMEHSLGEAERQRMRKKSRK